jgi:hypothetical protein
MFPVTIASHLLSQPSTDRRRFSLRSRPDPVDGYVRLRGCIHSGTLIAAFFDYPPSSSFQSQNNTAEPPQFTDPFTGKPVDSESSRTTVGNGVRFPFRIWWS